MSRVLRRSFIGVLVLLLASGAYADDTAWQAHIMPTGRISTETAAGGITGTGCAFNVVGSGGLVPACAPLEQFVFTGFWPDGAPTIGGNAVQFGILAESGSTAATNVNVCVRAKALALTGTGLVTQAAIDTDFGNATGQIVSFTVDDANPSTILESPWSANITPYNADLNTNCTGTACEGVELMWLIERVSSGSCATNELPADGSGEESNLLIRAVLVDDGRGG